MESNYEAKFEEMKKYIPFLESMIKQLETPCAASNPRQAQLDKIRSLRDLLMDRKKRMKMENLLKCEQVLINLYSKVQERDTLPGIIGPNRSVPEAPEPPDITGLDVVRTKLKTVSKDTLPEIQRLNETEEVCTPGSKEPALFQRRPNKTSKSPSRESTSDNYLPHKTKRNYTRVLVSPEPSDRRWKPDDTSDKPLFSRRSPGRSPKKSSPGHSKKDKHKSQGSKGQAKNVNIMVELPQDRLNLLSREDLGSRILNCSDNDVNIDILRVMRTKILDELKNFGGTDDISELLFKSSKKKSRKKYKTDEVEEGELSDSESEAIEKIYGSISIVDKDNHEPSQSKVDVESDKQPNKIQINLVINNQEKKSIDRGCKTTIDPSEFEMFDSKELATDENTKADKVPVVKKDMSDSTKSIITGIEINEQLQPLFPPSKETKTNNKAVGQDVISIDDEYVSKAATNAEKQSRETLKSDPKSDDDVSYVGSSTIDTTFLLETLEGKSTRPKKSFKPNFYNEQENKDVDSNQTNNQQYNNNQPSSSHINDTAEKEGLNKAKENSQTQSENSKHDDFDRNKASQKIFFKTTDKNEEIPLINTKPIVSKPTNTGAVSEIDILQALKNDILSESIAIPNAVPTPALHQPQITKVVNANSITKRTISIEKYKQKSVTSNKMSLFTKDPNRGILKEENAKKQSLKLTEKECERFKFPAKLALHSSDEEEDDTTTLKDIYGDLGPISPETDLAPKSPEDVIGIHSTPPIIIPVDPLPAPAKKASVSDVDMRILSPSDATVGSPLTTSPALRKDPQFDLNINQNMSEIPKISPLLADPRMRRDPRAINPDRTPVPGNYPNMTPNRTPSYAYLENDDEKSSKKHVYAPIIPTHEPSLDHRERSISREYNRDPQWDLNFDARSEERRSRWEQPRRQNYNDLHTRSTSIHRDSASDCQKSWQPYHSDKYASRIDRRDERDDYSYSQMDGPRTPVHHFGRSDCPSTPTPSFGRRDSPRTPVHPFGRADCPSTIPPFEKDASMTPSHPFSRDIPMTPSHPFSTRNEMPLTPSHPFGRGETPMTPSHPFGRSEPSSGSFVRSETPITPTHPFGRSERPMTPNHPFGRSDYSQNKSNQFAKDPRLNRSTECDTRSKRFDRYTDREYYERRQTDSSRTLLDYQPHGRFQNFVKDRSVGRNEAPYVGVGHRREPSLGRVVSRDNEWDEKYLKHRRGATPKRDFPPDRETRDCNKYGFRKNFQRAQSMGRTDNRYRDDFRRDRAPSVGRNYNNTLSVESQSGRRFIIDTSVNNTFLEFLNDKGLKEFDFSFDDRRKRASSVGRYLSSEKSARPSRNDYNITFHREGTNAEIRKSLLPKPCSSTHNQVTSDYKKLVNFVRARSMSRDVTDSTPRQSFKEVKEDLKSFSVSSNQQVQLTEKKLSEKKINYRDPRSRQEEKMIAQNQRGKKSPKTCQFSYSPRKNSRDPRMHREPQHNEKGKYSYDNRHRKSGIVYSNDNIASGSILGSGYGVKNYKIPKIKKTVDETPIKDNQITRLNEEIPTGVIIKKENTVESRIKIDKEIALAKEKEQKKTLENETRVQSKNSPKKGKNKEVRASSQKGSVSNSDDETFPKNVISGNDGKRMTRARSRRRSVSCDEKKFDDETMPKHRKSRKAVIQSESESEENCTIATEQSHEILRNLSKTDKDLKDRDSVVSHKENAFGVNDGILDHSFSIDDFEASSGQNLNANSLLANIDSLIDSLDNDLNSNTDIRTNIKSTVLNLNLKKEEIKEPKISDEVLQDMSNNKSSLTAAPSSENHEVQPKYKSTSESSIMDSDIKNHDVEVRLENDKPTSESSVMHSDIKLDEHQIMDEESERCSEDSKIQLLGQKLKYKETDSSELLAVDSNNKIDEPRLKDKESKPLKSHDLSDCCKTIAIVSTSDMVGKLATGKDELGSNHTIEANNIERCSTPDSTINTIEPIVVKTKDEILPDSTKESTNEMNPHVTSTDDPQSKQSTSKVCDSESSHPSTQIESLGDFLSMLQDKSKIKELLSMLGDKSSETEKIKKKLEMLVSDDENDAQDNKDTLENSSEKTVDVEAKDSKVETEKYIEETRENDNKTENEATDSQADNSEVKQQKIKNVSKKHRKVVKKSKKGKTKSKQVLNKKQNRVTRSRAAKSKGRPSRELKQLQESIKEMFMSDDILNATGIRMCRLAKLVDGKNNQEEDNNAPCKEISPVVVLQKFQDCETEDRVPLTVRKKPGPKPKPKPISTEIAKEYSSGSQHKKSKPGPKSSKTKIIAHDDSDPYTFDTDSVSDVTATKSIGSTYQESTDSESDSLASSRSFGSSETLADLKKKTKRKRRPGWKSGVISKRKKKIESKETEETDASTNDKKIVPSDQLRKIDVPDKNCFTDKTYCFRKNTTKYSCRLCDYTNTDIVNHYKNQHPHSEIPLSRLSPNIAEKAISQSAFVNFQAICKVATDKYVCRFCFKQFKTVDVIETFFWHVVSMHTGEYKQACPECLNDRSCPFNLDIPPPPKNGQLIGYICEKCNFTQISLENLKTHVTVRHNDERTSVCTINLSDMSEKMIKILMKRSQKIEVEEHRKLRSSNQSSTGVSDDHTDVSGSTEPACEQEVKQLLNVPDNNKPSINKNIVSKITFEEDIDSEFEDLTPVKIESTPKVVILNADDTDSDIHTSYAGLGHVGNSDDVFDYPHFKICYTESGTKEYVCCVNGKDNHYKTSLLISMKKHIQSKHAERWDGYCFICKVIVTSQGEHLFKECLQHYVDKHFDNFPLLEAIQKPTVEETLMLPSEKPDEKSSTPVPSNTLISVRPINELIDEFVAENNLEVPLPIIQNIDSCNAPTVDPPLPSPSYPETMPMQENSSIAVRLPPTVKKISATPEEIHKYEEVQANVMSNKHNVVLQTMMSNESLARIFKCAGRFCSFTSDFVEAAWSHASTHQRQGGENALICTYCDYDSKGNASDLVTHVFKVHGNCRYSCGVCFYRAVASQLVQAHIDRVHGQVWSQVKVLESTTNYATKEPVVPLSRELAVKYYVCVNDEPNCKYKTFILNKFNEHLAKHEAPYKCSVCSSTFQNITDLIQHLKGHSMNLYQCTWCVHGAENEADLLAHASARHPSRQPQAYVRTVNSKDPSKQMVLPLAKLNKTIVVTQAVKPSTNCEDPVREAERSIDLEKLIGSVATPIAVSDSIVPMDLADEDDAFEMPLSLNEPEADESIPELSTHTTTHATTEDENLSSRVTPILKTEPLDKPATLIPTQEIISLDSDDEEPKTEIPKNVIDLSDDDAPATLRRISTESSDKVLQSSLFRCARCYMTCKTLAMFKRHINVCYPSGTTLRCAHCEFETDLKDNLYSHYNLIHGKADKRETRISNNTLKITPSENVYKCGMCDYREKTLNLVKNHVRHDHKITNLTVTSQFGSNGKNVEFTIRGLPSPNKKPASKRKLSSGSLDSPMKRKRYSLQDLDQLPVKPILDDCAYCAECDFNTKVRLNLVRHLQQHAEKRHIVPNTVPLNPVPHLETNEKHFDKMVNLASSSIEVSRIEKTSKADSSPTIIEHIPPDQAARYPKYVPDRQLHTCGAKECSYISVDQAMLKRHWKALHGGINDYHCVHCPPYQQLDTSCQITVGRIMAHLRMHKSNLYACSACPYYHHKRDILEKHLIDVHKGSGKVMIVREESSTPVTVTSTSQISAAAPTMDLKPWQCGLCEFKSLLRAEVLEHCTKTHNSKMQFKCPNCPFRTSTEENVLKHKMKSHPESKEDVFYYYYRVGSIPDEADGTPRWKKQKQKMGNTEPEVKTETEPTPVREPLPPMGPISAPPVVDLNKVKKELPEIEETIEELCNRYGKFCDPNGLKYKCPLCKVVTENSKDVMQSHLFEELKYRKWGCSICAYKAFHKRGLNDHMYLEHRQRTAVAVELPLDKRIEKWVAKFLEHQSSIIEKNKAAVTLLNQNVRVEQPTTTPIQEKPVVPVVDDARLKTLEQAFGKLGTPQGMDFCCPKCDYKIKNEGAFKNHLETELNKIRWRCNNCSTSSQNYHEAQLHCKTCTAGTGSACPVEAVRDPALRSSWLNTAIRVQKQAMNVPEEETVADDFTNIPGPLDNSLLVVRYEERVPTPEEEMLVRRKRATPTTLPSTSHQLTSPESDDERLVIDEHSKTHEPKKRSTSIASHQCKFCDFTSKYAHVIFPHTLRHFNLKPYSCDHCSYSCYKTQKKSHHVKFHPDKEMSFTKTSMPSGPPCTAVVSAKGRRKSVIVDAEDKSDKKEECPKVICLECDKSIPENEKHAHVHNQFAVKGQVVVKCCICLALLMNLEAMQEHHNSLHPSQAINYAFFKLHHDKRELLICGHCNKAFTFLNDMRAHHNTVHSSLQIKYESKLFVPGVNDVQALTDVSDPLSCHTPDESTLPLKSQEMQIAKKNQIAKKSTTKPPI